MAGDAMAAREGVRKSTVEAIHMHQSVDPSRCLGCSGPGSCVVPSAEVFGEECVCVCDVLFPCTKRTTLEDNGFDVRLGG